MSIDERVRRQKALRVVRRLEALHLPFPTPGWSMRDLSSIIQIAALPVFNIREQRALRHAIAAQFVGDEDTRRILQTFQQALEKALCRPCIAASLPQDIKHEADLIARAPESMTHTPDRNEELTAV